MKHPKTPRPAVSACERCGKVLVFRWGHGSNTPYAWRHRKHDNYYGLPCVEEKPKPPKKKPPPRVDSRLPPFDELTITVHAIQMVQKREGIGKPHECVEWIEKVYPAARWAFYQDSPKARSPGTLRKRQRYGLRAPHKPTRVDVFTTEYGDRTWRFFVRGKVLLTVDYEGMDYEDRLYPERA